MFFFLSLFLSPHYFRLDYLLFCHFLTSFVQIGRKEKKKSRNYVLDAWAAHSSRVKHERFWVNQILCVNFSNCFSINLIKMNSSLLKQTQPSNSVDVFRFVMIEEYSCLISASCTNCKKNYSSGADDFLEDFTAFVSPFFFSFFFNLITKMTLTKNSDSLCAKNFSKCLFHYQ